MFHYKIIFNILIFQHVFNFNNIDFCFNDFIIFSYFFKSNSLVIQEDFVQIPYKFSFSKARGDF